jgi:hypothetical protein
MFNPMVIRTFDVPAVIAVDGVVDPGCHWIIGQ